MTRERDFIRQLQNEIETLESLVECALEIDDFKEWKYYKHKLKIAKNRLEYYLQTL